jgi:hypothetical protein
MLTVNVPRNTNWIGDQTYTYDENCAAALFSCTRETITYSGNSCSGTVLNGTKKKIATPLSLAIANSCSLFNGNQLQGSNSSSCTVKTVNNKKQATKTITTCATNVVGGDPVPLTCWENIQGEQHTVKGNIAREKVTFAPRGGNHLPDLLVYSFDLEDETNYVTGLAVEELKVTVSQGENILDDQDLDGGELSLELVKDGEDFLYSGSAGATGTVELLTSSGSGYNPLCKQENPAGNPPGALVSDILGPEPKVGNCESNAKDTSSANDGEGGDMVEYRNNSPIPQVPGSYLITVNGTMAGELNMAASKAINVNRGCTTK